MATTITTAVQLQAMQDDLAEDYVLGCDIDASDTVNWNSGAGFVPISIFTGTFDGKGYTISDLYINITSASTIYAGLFGLVNGATIENVKFVSADITGDATGDNVWCNVGVAVGEIDGADTTIDCVRAAGTASATCDDTGGAGQTGATCGGIVGKAVSATLGSPVISKCSTNVTVTATAIGGAHSSSGGIVGVFAPTVGGTIPNSFARGSVTATSENYQARAGGLVGYFYNDTANIDDSYSTGAVTSADAAGGLVGSTSGSCTVTNSFWDTETSGQAASAGGTGKITAQMKTSATFIDAGWDLATIWAHRTEVNNGYPYLRCGSVPTPLVFPVDPVTRVSSIRRVYKPGLYRMELALGDLGFDVDVSEAAIRRIPDKVTEPEIPPEDEPVFKRPEEPDYAKPFPGPDPNWMYTEERMPYPMKEGQIAVLKPKPTVSKVIDVANIIWNALYYVTHPGALVTTGIRKLRDWLT